MFIFTHVYISAWKNDEKCPICELLMSHVNRRSVCTPIQQQVERQTEAPVPRCYPRLEKSFISTTNKRTPWRKKGVDLTSPVLQDRWLYFSRWIFLLISPPWFLAATPFGSDITHIRLPFVTDMQCWSMKESTPGDIQTWNVDELQIKIERQGAKRDANQHDPNIVASNFRPGRRRHQSAQGHHVACAIKQKNNMHINSMMSLLYAFSFDDAFVSFFSHMGQHCLHSFAKEHECNFCSRLQAPRLILLVLGARAVCRCINLSDSTLRTRMRKMEWLA